MPHDLDGSGSGGAGSASHEPDDAPGWLGAATELPPVAGLRGGAHGPDRRAGPHQRELPLVGDHRVTPQVSHHFPTGAVDSDS